MLIWLGVGMWVPYFALKLSGAEISMMPFLALHLCGVIPGSILLRGETVVKMLARWLNRRQGVEED